MTLSHDSNIPTTKACLQPLFFSPFSKLPNKDSMAAIASFLLFARLQTELKPLHDCLLVLLNSGEPVGAIEPRNGVTPFSPEFAQYFEDLAQSGVKYRVISKDFWAARLLHSDPATEKMFGADSLVPEKDQRAAVTYNRCRVGAVALWTALTVLYAAGMKKLLCPVSSQIS